MISAIVELDDEQLEESIMVVRPERKFSKVVDEIRGSYDRMDLASKQVSSIVNRYSQRQSVKITTKSPSINTPRAGDISSSMTFDRNKVLKTSRPLKVKNPLLS